MQRKWFSPLSVFFALAVATVLAQGPRPGGGMKHYDPKTETTIKGTIIEVQQPAGMGGWTGTHLILKTDARDLEVHAGPSAYISQKQFSFAKGDTIEVLGSKVTLQGKEALLAREITKDGRTLVLRNAQGIPEWSGGPRRNY